MASYKGLPFWVEAEPTGVVIGPGSAVVDEYDVREFAQRRIGRVHIGLVEIKMCRVQIAAGDQDFWNSGEHCRDPGARVAPIEPGVDDFRPAQPELAVECDDVG